MENLATEPESPNDSDVEEPEQDHHSLEARRKGTRPKPIGLKRADGYTQRVKQTRGVSNSSMDVYRRSLCQGASFNPYDYEQKYPEDPFCEEAGPNARVWRTYLDVAEEYDAERIDGWKDTIDVLLIFVRFFSHSL